MDNAYHTLALPYTYNLIGVPPEKRVARRQLGTMSADIIKQMRNELALAAVATFLFSRGLTSEQIEVILEDTDGQSPTGINLIIIRASEREGTSTQEDTTSGHRESGDRQHTIEDSIFPEGVEERVESSRKV